MTNKGILDKVNSSGDFKAEHDFELPQDDAETTLDDYYSVPEMMPEEFKIDTTKNEREDTVEVGPKFNATQKREKWPEPPKLEQKDMLTENGDVLDFSQARDYQELIEMIRNQEYITNQLGQRISAETIINLIYKLTYQDLKKYQKEDWTNITLRHNLRATVANLIRDYKESSEFLSLRGLDLSDAQSLEDVFNLLNNKGDIIDVTGKMITASQAIGYIRSGRLDLLPPVVRFKVIEINRQSNLPRKVESESKPENSWSGKIKNGFAKLKFWGK